MLISPPPARTLPVTSVTSQLLRLDASVRPGLAQDHFWALFTQCTCGVVTTWRAFESHHCHVAKKARIDNTDSGDTDYEW